MNAAELEVSSFGYLTGYDLLQVCAPQLLITRYNIDSGCLQRGCNDAYGRAIRSLMTRYDVTDELKKNGPVPAMATAVVTAGVITAINFTPGLGFTSAPQVVITDASGTGAAATAIITNTQISSIPVSAGGANYVNPVVLLSDGQQDTRENLLVQILRTIAVKKILGNLEKISDKMKQDFNEAEQDLLDIREGQLNLILPLVARCEASLPRLVCQRFRTIG